jgi:hypothetical protein
VKEWELENGSAKTHKGRSTGWRALRTSHHAIPGREACSELLRYQRGRRLRGGCWTAFWDRAEIEREVELTVKGELPSGQRPAGGCLCLFLYTVRSHLPLVDTPIPQYNTNDYGLRHAALSFTCLPPIGVQGSTASPTDPAYLCLWRRQHQPALHETCSMSKFLSWQCWI